MNQLVTIVIILILTGFVRDELFSTIQVGTKKRSFILQAPDRKIKGHLPLFIVIHPQNGSAKQVFQKSEMWERLRSSAILVFPDALERRWECSKAISTDNYDNDLLFLDTIISTLSAEFIIDERDIHIIAVNDSYCIASEFAKTYGAGKVKIYRASRLGKSTERVQHASLSGHGYLRLRDIKVREVIAIGIFS